MLSDPADARKHVLYLITKATWGGAGRYVYDLATRLPRNEFRVTVAAGGSGRLLEELRAQSVRTLSIESLERDVKAGAEVRSFFALVRMLRRERPDILHLNSSKAGALGALAGRLAGVPRIIFTAHGWAFNEQRGAFEKQLIRGLHLLTVLLAHTTIVVSERTKEQLRAPRALRPRMWVIHNGIESDVSTLTKKRAREELFPAGTPAYLDQSDTIWLGSIAELHRNKGLDVLIDALGRIRERPITTGGKRYGCVIIGEGEEREALQERIDRHQLNDAVHLIGFRDNAARLLPAFDVFVLPSRTEALPYTLLEAGVASLPVVASHVGGIPEIIHDMESGVLVRPDDPRELERSLRYLATEREYLHVYATRLHEHVARTFSIQTMLESTLRCYRHTTPRRPFHREV